MKATKLLFLLLIMTPSTTMALPSSDDPGDTQYLIIVAELSEAERLNSGHIYISINGYEYRKKKISRGEVAGDYDYSALIDLIKKFNREGWSLINGKLSATLEQAREGGRIFILMTRSNPYRIKRTPIDTIYRDSTTTSRKDIPDEPLI